MSDVASIFSRPSVLAFGRALRRRWRPSEKVGDRWVVEKDLDYATLADLENAQTPEQFAEVTKAFLRRFTAYANRVRHERGDRSAPRPPSESDLVDLMAAVEEEGVAVVRTALIAHALVRSARADHNEEDRGEDDE